MMVNHLLDAVEIHGDLEDFILEKTEGVPFFIEEFIRSLKDLKIIERKDKQYLFAKDFLEMTIPSTIQDVIMARVDSLPEGAKEVIQTGSVIEREFSYELIKRVMGLPEQELLSRLSILKDTELLYERGIYPDTTYIFKHALTCEAVYNSLLTRRKKEFHEDIGNAIEELYKENIDEYYGILAEHFIYSESYENGAEYCRLAAKKAEKAASFPDAIAYGKKRIVCLERLHWSENVEMTIVDARTTLGLYVHQLSGFTEAKEAIDPIVDIAIKRDYKRRVSQIYTIIGTYNLLCEEDFPKAFKYFEDALRIAKDLNDILSLFMATYWLGYALYINCEYEKALYYFEKALKINIATNTIWGISIAKGSISTMVYAPQGKIKLAYQTSHEALRIAEESGDIYSKAQTYLNHGYSYFLKGFLKEAKEHFMKAADFSERINQFLLAIYANFFLGEIYFSMGNHKICQEYYERSIVLVQHGRLLPSMINVNKIAIAKSKVMNNAEGINLNEILKCHKDIKVKIWEVSMLNSIGLILLHVDDQHCSEAEDWIKKAIETNKRYGMMWNLAQDYALYAELYNRKGDPSNAKEKLNKAIEIFKECGADGWVEKYEKELASFS